MIDKRNNLLKKIFWYILSVFVPIFINFIKTLVFTRYFTPSEYGELGIINTTFQFISIILYSWLISCVWRYYINYKEEKKIKEFYSTIMFLYFMCSCISMLISIFWVSMSKNYLINILIILSSLQIFSLRLIAIYLTCLNIEGKAKEYSFLNIFRNIVSFIILFILTFKLNSRIEAMILCEVIANFILIIYIIRKCLGYKFFSVKYISIETIKKFMCFGIPSIICELSLLVLTCSDRYIIQYFKNSSCVGIYNEIYKLSELSIYCLVTIFFNTINDSFLKQCEKNVYKSDDLVQMYKKKYIILLAPFVIYFSIFSKQICSILLGENFREGYTMMPSIMITAFIYGLSQFNQIRLKYKNKMNVMVKGFIICAIINILLNFVFIPILGYKFAATSTLIAYFILYLYYYFTDKCSISKKKSDVIVIFKFLLILLIEIVADLLLRKVFYINNLCTIVEGMLFLIIYLIFMNKEFKIINMINA